MSEIKKCSNPSCSCIPPENDECCSEHCAHAKQTTVETVCECGHRGCGQDALEIQLSGQMDD
jgi:hypothetical protein